MSSGSPECGPADLAKSENATLGTSEEQLPSQLPSISESAPEGSQKSHSIIGSDKSSTTEETGIEDGQLLSEVRGSLQTISNGVEELANTVQDLLGLSDSDTTGGSDYDSDGHARLSLAKLRSRARTRRRARRLRKDAPGRGQDTSTGDDSDSDDERSKKDRKIKLEIRECNFEQFQSVPADSRHDLYCADILMADDSLPTDIQNFKGTAAKIGSRTAEPWRPGQVSSRTEDRTTENTANEKWIRRIRINSPAVMKMLEHLCSGPNNFRGRPTVFVRPFQLLVSSHEEFKENLTKVKGLASSVPTERTNATDSADTVNMSTARTPDQDDTLQKLARNKNAVQELTYFVEFMEARIMPDSRRYRDPSSTGSETIRYEDLWYLFKPGDFVYVPWNPSSSDRYKSSAFSQRILRVIQTRMASTSPIKPLRLKHDGGWCLICYFIEHDGTSYSPTYIISPRILPFLGEKKVTELDMYPISYLEDEKILAQAESDGATYVSLIERRSGYYSGWTQTTDPIGRPFPPMMGVPPGDRSASPEHIESDILVDFQETFNAFPGWKLMTYPEGGGSDRIETGLMRCVQSDLPLLEWDETGRARHDKFDQFLARDTTEATETSRFLKEDTLGHFKKDTRTAPTGKFLALLPARFFAYAVLQRKFVQLNTRFVRSADLEANDKAFEKLEIDRNYKRLILALVKSHFEKVDTEKKTNTEIGTQDLIRGKGKGVVILLHGVPGVGKTATAEAVALKWKKPLFPITCGDLGFTAETLEKSLNEIFRLAHHWGCILLLDEADVFITRRERHDLKRNALVSGKTHKLYFVSFYSAQH